MDLDIKNDIYIVQINFWMTKSKGVFRLERRFEGVDLKLFERKVKLFGLKYIRIDL